MVFMLIKLHWKCLIRDRKTENRKDSNCWFTLPRACNAQGGPGQEPEVGNSIQNLQNEDSIT